MSDADRPFTLQVMHAVAASDLPPQLRHFVMTLALLANSETGVGWYGQQAIASAMGCSDRQVRSYFRELEAHASSPVRVERRRRGSSDGKGRSSDEWQLRLFPPGFNRKPASASDPTPGPASTGTTLPPETPSTGSALPFQLTPPGGAQPEVWNSSTGSLEQLNRKPTSGDRRRDRRSDRRSEIDARERAVFDAWASKLWSKLHRTGNAMPTERRLKPIRARLLDGFTPEQLTSVFDKVAASKFHMDGGYIEPKTILRNSETVEGWLVKVAHVPRRNGAPVVQSGGRFRQQDNTWFDDSKPAEVAQ